MNSSRSGNAVPLCMCLLLAAAPASAAIDLDLGFVDTGGPAYLRFKTWVDAAVAGSPGYAFSATDAAFMARLDGAPQYCTLAVQIVEQQVADAEAVIAGGGRPEVSGDSYLHVGDYIGDLALTYDWCAAAMTPSQRTRWASYAEQAVWNVWNPDDAVWGDTPHSWSGWSINDPGNNYYYSFLEATMSWALASDSASWRTFLETEKIPPLQDYFAALPGGGSGEGTGYGTSHMRLFWLYRLWRDSTGTDLAAANSHTADSIPYWVHATVPTNDRFAPIGDQSRTSEPVLFDYQRRIVLEARALSPDAPLRELASGWLNRISVGQMEQGFNFRHDLLDAGSAGALPAALHHHATGAGHLFARTGRQADDLWLAVVAGRFDQSHAHEDQGGFTLYGVGEWLAVTQNIWTHSGIQQGGEVHNVLRFDRNGAPVRQRRNTESSMSVVRNADGSYDTAADLTPAYAGQAGVTAWTRTLHLDEGGLLVDDRFTVDAQTSAVFQLNLPNAPTITGQTARSGPLQITVLEPADAQLQVLDWRSIDAAEFRGGWKLEISGAVSTPTESRYLVQLGIADHLFRNGFEARD